MARSTSKTSKKKSLARDFDEEIDNNSPPLAADHASANQEGPRASDDHVSIGRDKEDDDKVVTPPTMNSQLPPLKASNLDSQALNIGTNQDKSAYRQVKAATIRISTLSEALKFAELYVQILKEGLEAIAALGSSSKAKPMADRLNKRRVALALTISAWDIDLQSVTLNAWLGFLNWTNEATNVDQAVNEALMDSTRLVLATQPSSHSSSIKKQQDRWDRIRKNRAPFYPKKLDCSSELSSFLKALELVSPFTPQWDDVLTFEHDHKTYKLYNYLQFHSVSSVVSAMTSYDYLSRKHLVEGSFSLFLSLKSSISSDVLDRLELYSDLYKTNGALLLVYLIKLLSPELNKIRAETSDFMDNLQKLLQDSDWDVITVAPKVCEQLRKRKHAGGDMSGMHEKVINSFANSGEGSYQTKHQAWVTKHSDSGDGNSAILYLYSAVEWVKELHSTGQWKNKKIPSCLHPSSKKRPPAVTDTTDIASFPAEAQKKIKALEDDLKKSINTTNQLRAAKKARLSNGQSKKPKDKESEDAATSATPAPAPRPAPSASATSSKVNKWKFNDKQYGPNCSYPDRATFEDFYNGRLSSNKEEAEKGYIVRTGYGNVVWHWCEHCKHMTSHNTSNHRFKSAFASAPAATANTAMATLASASQQSASKTIANAHSVDDSDSSSIYED
jgi:hypothetical protein